MNAIRPPPEVSVYPILYYSILYYEAFLRQKSAETHQKPPYFFISSYENPSIRQFLLQKLTRNTTETLQKYNWPRENRVNPCDEINWPHNQCRNRIRWRRNDHRNSSQYPSSNIVWTARQLDFKQYCDKDRIPNMECDEKSIHEEFVKF